METIKVGKRTFRYNEKQALLERVHEGEVITATGLSRENWKEDKRYWAELYNQEIEEELRCMMADLKAEFGL